jgi:hypothetical protein
MTGFNGQLLVGLAMLLDEDGVGVYTPGGASVEGAGLPAITLLSLPQTPDRVICLTDYPLSADPALTDVVVGVQVRVRGTRAPLDASDIRDGVYDALQGRAQLPLPNGFYLVHLYWQSESPIGPDSNGRFERTINYYAHANRAGAEQE